MVYNYPGLYAIEVVGDLPVEAVEICNEQGIPFRGKKSS
jgi:hypothetical protein